MAKDAIVSEELAKKFSTEKDTPYLRWVRSEGLDLISAHYVQNLRTVELKPWARRGGSGVYINHEAVAHVERLLRLRDSGQDARAAPAVRGVILVLDGRGSTTVAERSNSTHPSVEGGRCSRSSSCEHQHFNGSGRRPRATSPS